MIYNNTQLFIYVLLERGDEERGIKERYGAYKVDLSVAYEDKTKLKIIAAKRNTSISAMLHEWLQENAKEAEE